MSDALLCLVATDLHDDVARCAAAAGYHLILAAPGACRADWLRAAVVVVDPAAVAELASTAVPRRPGVLLVAATEPPAATWRAALDLGATDAALLPADEDRLVRTLTRLRTPARRSGAGVALIGAHGGAGTSVLAAAVALVAAGQGDQVLLLDIDELAGGLDLILGLEDAPGLRWQDLALEGGAVGATALHHALPKTADGISLLTGHRDDPRPIPTEAVLATIDAGRGNGDLVVVDLPRADTDAVRGALESVELTALITAPTVAGCAAARQVAGRLLSGAPDVGLVVRGPSPGGLRPAQIAAAVGLPLLASFRPDPRLPARLEEGRLEVGGRRHPLTQAAHAVYQGVVTARSA